MNSHSPADHRRSTRAAALVAAGLLLFGCGRDSSIQPPSPAAVARPDAQTEARAAAGDAAAQLALGRWYLGESGQSRDYRIAAHWLTKAADGGQVEARYLLGTLHEAGGGVERSPTNALKYFQLAAAQHHSGALYNLGSMYAAGRGVPQDSATAAKFYEQAAQLGDPLAQFNVAQRYELGRGVATNLVEAWKWFSLAAAGGVEDAVRGRARVEGRLSAAEAAEARRRLKEFDDSQQPVKR
jgi:TPR repeat protein